MSESSDEDEVEYEVEDFLIGGKVYSLTTIAYMPITKLMKLNESSTEISGQKLWCGSLVVMEYLLTCPSVAEGAVVLELGAGTGVTGMLCKNLGCRRVFLTDHDERSLDHMSTDIERNDITAQVFRLDWFQYDEASVKQLLFESDESDNVPFLIVAGDVLYKRALIDPFFTVATSLLSRNESEMLLCHVPRAGVEQRDVVEYAVKYGLHISEIPPKDWKRGIVLDYSVADDYERACLYRIKSNIKSK